MYSFAPLDSSAGHRSARDPLRFAQAAHSGHHQPAFYLRDRAPCDSRVLDPNGAGPLGELPDVRFRADPEAGRVVWTIDGRDCTKHIFPPNLRNLEFTPHSLICEMDHAGVDVALLHTDPMLGRDSAYLADCVRAYPGRIYSMAPVDEWRIATDADAVIEELTTAIKTHRLHAIKFIPPYAYRGSPEAWDDGPYRTFWQAATALRVPVFFTLGTTQTRPATTPEDHLAGYREELNILMRWMNRYPDTLCSLTHGFPWRVLLEKDRIKFPGWIWEPFANPSCNVEVCFPIRVGDLFEYPYRELHPALETMLQRIGAPQLLWGTDMPFQNRVCTYRQSRRWIEEHCAFICARDRELLMGATASRILGLGTEPV